jgi:multidrug efflux pump subunit AcrA (membrane-fusion protein)
MFKLKYNNLLWVLAIMVTATACNHKKTTETHYKLPLPTVNTGHPVVKNQAVYESFRAVSRYLQDVNFRARTQGIVTKVFTTPGDEIHTGQPLFIIKPVELSALEKSSISHQMGNISDTIFSKQNILTNQVMVQQGDYVQPGSLLASAFKKNSLVALTYVPFSKVSSIKKNNPCTVFIPGRKTVNSFFKRQLFSADSVTQTQPFIVPLPSNLHLSEGMNLQVNYKEKEITNGIFVPRDAVLSNEEETSFWIMKIAGNSTAIKVPVTIGLRGENSIQILTGNIKPSDEIVTQGAYGLSDSTRVKIVK